MPKGLIIRYKDRKCAELLGAGKQAQIIGPGKKFKPGHRPFRIVKSIWGLCQVFNREGQGWRIEEKNRKNYSRLNSYNRRNKCKICPREKKHQK